jgi:FkbM family methyltransferase
MSAIRATLQRAALAAYEAANRRGLLDSRVAEAVFQRAYFTYKRLVEDPFAKLVGARPELFRGGDAIDVGANIGYTAALFARAIDDGRRVHAFEPEERNFRWLGRAIARNGLTARISPQRAAVGARVGTVSLWHNDAHHADHRIATDALDVPTKDATQSVPLTTLDAYVASIGGPPVAFIKIDVQGYEPEVLRGMRATLAANPRVHVAVELMPSGIDGLGFDTNDFLRELADALPRLTILERDGTLREADAAAILRAIEDSGVGYVDLVCGRA